MRTARTYAEARLLASEARAEMYEAQAEVTRLHPDPPDESARETEVQEWRKLAARERAEAARWRARCGLMLVPPAEEA